MTNLFKRRGSIRALTRNHERESQFMARIEERIDTGAETCGLIEAIVTECRVRTVSFPDDASWRLYLGRFLMAAGDPIEARDELKQAALLDPRDPRIPVHLALWYEAALLAARGESANVDLPALAGPWLSADATHFADIDEQVAAAVLAQRAVEWLNAALRFSLPREDARFLQHHIDLVQQHLSAAEASMPVSAPANVTLITRAG